MKYIYVFKFINIYLPTVTEPWEIDPTNPDGEGAGAEGGAVGGGSAGDTTLPPPLQPTQDVDRTNPFEATWGTSTPYPPPDDSGELIELGDMNLDEMELDADDIPLLTGFTDADEKETVLNKTLRFIKDKFSKVDFKKLGSIGWGHQEENEGEIVQFGPRLDETRVLKKDGFGPSSITHKPVQRCSWSER